MAVKETKEEQDVLFEEEQRKLQCENIEEYVDTESQCKNCEKMMSDMRKSSIRWLYLELYKKAVQGLTLPNISELTQTLSNVLRETYAESDKCKHCGVSIDCIIEKTLQPMNSLSTSSLRKQVPQYENVNKTTEQNKLQMQTVMECTKPEKIDKCTTQQDCKQTLTEDKYPSASFFARAALKLNLPTGKSRKPRRNEEEMEDGQVKDNFLTNFSDLIMRTPPHAPPNLFKTGTVRRGDGHGKVRMTLRVADKRNKDDSCLHVDLKKKQALLRESSFSLEHPNKLEKGPRLYSFDNIYESNTPVSELCSGVLVDLLHAVVNGNDSCLLTYGYPKLGKSSIMVGSDEASRNIGIIPCAISWLYQLIDDRKQRTGARFSIRVSAVEIVGKSENLKDLLGEQGGGSINSNATSPSIYLPRERASSIQLSDFTELRASNAEKAAFYFDAAINARTASQNTCNDHDEFRDDPDERRNSNMIFTLHVYQYMIDKVGTGEIHGGRSRLHLIDLSGCSRKKRSRDTGQGTWLPISALGNVIVSLANGTKHIPHRDSKLTTLLREAMGSLSVRVSMIANVSNNPKHCLETLSTLQVTSRIHRSRKKKSRLSSASSSGGDSSCDERRKHRRRCKPVTPLLRTDTCQSDNVGESEFTSTSAAEESCDTVIYRGPTGGILSDKELTDFEHPPESPHRNNEDNIQKKSDFILPTERNENKENTSKNEKVVSNDEPIVVNITPDSLLQSTLERKANKLKLLSNREQSSCLSTSTKSSNKTHIENKLRTTSVSTENDKHEHISSLPLKNSQHKERQCVSTNSSPSKNAFNFNDALITRTSSLDSLNTRKTKNCEENQLSPNYKSNETLDSVATVNNFERVLVTKIAERFALEDEFTSLQNDDANIFTTEDTKMIDGKDNKKSQLPPFDSEEFFIDDDLDSVCAGLENGDDSDFYKNENYSKSPTHVEVSEQRQNDVIQCNNCLGLCKCEPKDFVSTYETDIQQNACNYDSEEDTDERTDSYLRRRYSRKRNSFSSCDSHLDTSPRNFHKRPPSEGVSSGYESMRCESSANIHSASDNWSEKGRTSIQTKKDPFDEVIHEDDGMLDPCMEEENRIRFTRAQKYRAQIKELIEERQDLKAELHQTLKKLVLNRVPLPSIDDHLRQISSQCADTTKVLSRENRIIEKKVKVCKSHLQLVACFDNPPNIYQKETPRTTPMTSPLSSPRKRHQYTRSPEKSLKLSVPPIRKPYKVTSV